MTDDRINLEMYPNDYEKVKDKLPLRGPDRVLDRDDGKAMVWEDIDDYNWAKVKDYLDERKVRYYMYNNRTGKSTIEHEK